MKEASLADNEKVVVGGVRFFLGGDKEREEMEDESSDEETAIDIGKLRHQAGINKKTGKKLRSMDKAVATVKKVGRCKVRLVISSTDTSYFKERTKEDSTTPVELFRTTSFA